LNDSLLHCGAFTAVNLFCTASEAQDFNSHERLLMG
jgi:hypothetical protein